MIAHDVVITGVEFGVWFVDLCRLYQKCCFVKFHISETSSCSLWFSVQGLRPSGWTLFCKAIYHLHTDHLSFCYTTTSLPSRNGGSLFAFPGKCSSCSCAVVRYSIIRQTIHPARLGIYLTPLADISIGSIRLLLPIPRSVGQRPHPEIHSST